MIKRKKEQSPIPQLLRIAQLGLRNSLVGLCNLACATPRIVQLGLRNFQDCATLLAQFSGLRNSVCATLRIAQLCLRNSQDCATRLEDDPQVYDDIKILTPMELSNSLGVSTRLR